MNSRHIHGRLQTFVESAKTHGAMTTVIVHPCDRNSLEAAIEAARQGLKRPILVGPKPRITAIARQCGVDISPYECINEPHSDAAAAKAVELAREGHAAALMKGSLHTDKLMAEVVSRKTGLCTARRGSHCFVSSAYGAGFVRGARVPIVLAGGADSSVIRLASCAVAVLVASAPLHNPAQTPAGQS